MKQSQLINIFLDQSKDHIWIIDLDFQLIYANKKWLNLVKEVTGVEKKLYESAFSGGFGEVYIEKWKTYYSRALNGEYFEIEEHYALPELNEIQYGQITFEPLRGDDNQVFAVACLSRDITRIVQQRSEAHQLIDASLDVFCTINEQGNFVFVSAAAANHWGYSPEELIGTPYVNLILEEDLRKTSEIAAAILSGQDVKSFVNRYNKKNGGIAYNLWSVRWDKNDKLMYCVVRDAKEIIEQEEKILQSEQRFKALVQGGSDLIGILDEAGNYLYVSPTSSAVLGIAPEEFIGRNTLEFVHPDDKERVLTSLEKTTTENTVNVEPFRFQNHKKEWRWVETVLTNMVDNPGVKGIVANSRDVTHKIEEERQLKLLESVITHTNDAILITDAEPFDEPGPKIIYVNAAFTKMTGYEAEEVIGKTPRMLHGPKSNPKELAKLGHALRNWEPYEVTTINYKKSGEEFWINFTVTPVANEKGRYTHWISIERDVTEQKNRELEKELLAQISTTFNAENNLMTAATELCKSISKYGEFDWVELWTSNLEHSQMQLLSHFVANPNDEKFYDYSPELNTFKISQGLAGKVWAEGAQLIWSDIDSNKDFLRRDAAKKIGLKSMLGIPLIFKDEVIGVIKIGTRFDTCYLKSYGRLFQKLEGHIGSELNRKKLENDLSHLFNSIPDIICILDFQGRFLKMNKAGCDLLGGNLEGILYHTFDEFVHPDDKDIFTNKINDLEKGETTAKFENRHIDESGEIIWLSWYCNSVLETGLIYASAKNITDEKNLRELNRQVGQLAKIGSWEMDLVNGSLFWSDEVYRLHDTDPKSFTPNLADAINFYRADFRQMVRLSIENCIATREPYDFEAVIVTVNNQELWVRSNGNAEFVDGKCKRIYGSSQDIDDRKQSEIRLQSLADNLPGVVFQYLIYPGGTEALKYVTKGSQQLWGYSADEVVENNQLVWDRITAAGEYESVRKSIDDALTSKAKWTCRFKYVMPSGDLRTHLGTGTPSFLADGTILFNCVLLDITQEAKNEELLKQTAQIARIGSWEMNLINQDGDNMYWSPTIMEILELDDSYNPTLTGGLELHVGESKERIQRALDLLIKEGIEFDEELLLLTGKGNKRWNRAIGKSEIVNNKRTRIYGSYQDIHEQKVAALELEKSLKALKDYKYSLDQSAIIAFTDSKGIITSVNDNFCEISKYSREEIIGKTHRLINSQHHTKEFFKDLWVTIASGMVWRGEIKNKAKDDSYYWVDTTIVPFLDEKNRPLQYLAIRFDITERKKAEQEKNSLQTTIENSLNEIYIFDAEILQFSYVNKGALLNLGYSEQEIKALTPLDLKPDFTETSFMQLVMPLVNDEKEKIIFFTNHKRKDGSLYPVEIHLQFVSEGNNKRFLAIVLDITERKKAEESILQANERFEKVTEATNDAIWDWDIINKTFYRSEAIERFFGKEASKSFTEKDFWKDSFHPDDKDKVQESVDEAIADPSCTRWEQEYRLLNENGKTLYIIDRGVIIRNEDGKAIRMVGAMTDVSEQKQMTFQLNDLNQSLEQYTLELERSNEELEQFAFIASHDLQEPLRMVSSFMDLLKQKYGDQLDQKAHQYIHFATDGAKRMKQIILDLLEYSRAGRLTEGQEEVDLNEILAEFKQTRRKLISENSAIIRSNELPTLYYAKTAITQIFHSFLDNALKYANSGTAPIVDVKAIEKENEWEFSVKDNGIGIDKQFHKKIFIMFQRLHNKEAYAGTGIGLAIAKKHIEFLGGKIWLKSTLGKGTTFYFTIPKKEIV